MGTIIPPILCMAVVTYAIKEDTKPLNFSRNLDWENSVAIEWNRFLILLSYSIIFLQMST